MKKPLLFLLAALITGLFSGPLGAQMDMLPFLFRDLPPEWEQGLPEDLSYREFRQLNRSVDFFTIGMSMVLPGYALHYVEHPEYAWPVGLARWSTYGFMALAVGRQWGDMKHVWETQTISQDQWNNLNTNAWIFGGSLVANGFLWAADVLLAYHLAKDERDYVIYRHGLYPEDATLSFQDRETAYFRAQFRPAQEDAPLRSRILPGLIRALEDNRRSKDWGALSYWAGDLLFRDQRIQEALVYLLQGLYQDPDHGYRAQAKSLAMTILSLERGLKDRVQLFNLLSNVRDNPGSWDLEAPRFFQVLPALEDGRTRQQFLSLANLYLYGEDLPPSGDIILLQMAGAWEKGENLPLQALALAKLSVFYPESPHGEEARQKAKQLYAELGDKEAADRLTR